MAAGVSISVYRALGIICVSCLFVGAPGKLGLPLGNELGIYAPYSHSEIDLQSQYDLEFGIQGSLSTIRFRRDVVAAANGTATTSASLDNNENSTTASTSTSNVPSAMSSSAIPATDSTTPMPSTSTQEMTTMEIEKDDHDYYQSSVLRDQYAENLWVTLPEDARKTHLTLSDNHRVAASIKLSFVFPFYGHEVPKVTIATGGFLYMSDFLHQWLTATQYIAPLMANFDTKLGNNSNVHYLDNGTAFIVQWEDVYLQDHHSGKFNFQVVLHKEGNVVFNYKEIPVILTAIPNGNHPVKIGLSDAYYYDKPISATTRRRTIFEYHRVKIDADRITNNTAVIFTPMPTCIAIKDCHQCLTANISFDCKYCPEARRCSDGLDRHRQQWQQLNCHLTDFNNMDECDKYPHKPYDPSNPAAASVSDGNLDDKDKKKHGKFGVGGVVAILLVIFLVMSLLGIIIYAYKNPQSRAGMWLIEHRPSMLKAKLNHVRFLKRGDGSGEKYEVSMHPDGESVA